jgi:hypothetical protein
MSNDSSYSRSTEQDVWTDGDVARPSSLSHPVVTAVAMTAHAVALLPRHVIAPDAFVRLASLGEVTAQDVTGDQAPDLILAPLVARGFDATDLLNVLRDAGFRGRFLVLAPRMPDLPLVRAEMLMQAPDLNVDIIALDGTSALHLL